MRITCPDCDTPLKLKDSLAGKRVRCPRCGDAFQVPEEDADASDDEVEVPTARPAPPRRPPARDDDDDDEQEVVPRRRKKARRAASSKSQNTVLVWGALIGGGVLFVAAAVLVVVLALRRGDEMSADASKMASVPKPADTGPWDPDPTLLGRLDQEASLPDLSEILFRPPAGYTHNLSSMQGALIDTWTGPPWPDGSRPALLLTRYNLGAGGLFRHDLEREMNNLFDGMKKSQQGMFPDLTRSTSETRTVHGVQFARARVAGTSPGRGKADGFLYMGAVGDKTVVFFTIVLESHRDSLRLLETSVLTTHHR
jgi:predicted Zn finger-like uncharacterized protein